MINRFDGVPDGLLRLYTLPIQLGNAFGLFVRLTGNAYAAPFRMPITQVLLRLLTIWPIHYLNLLPCDCFFIGVLGLGFAKR
jgi:hypothetical protein